MLQPSAEPFYVNKHLMSQHSGKSMFLTIYIFSATRFLKLLEQEFMFIQMFSDHILNLENKGFSEVLNFSPS